MAPINIRDQYGNKRTIETSELSQYGIDPSEARSFWQFSPDDTAGTAARKWIQQAGQAATLGFADEIGGLAASGLQYLGQPFGTEYKSPSQNIAEIRGETHEAAQEAPGKALMAGIAGGVLPAVAAGPSAMSQVLLGATTGAGSGETPFERAVLGGVGAAAVPVLSGIGWGAGKLAQKSGLSGLVAGGKNYIGEMFSGSPESQLGAIGGPLKTQPLTAAERATAEGLVKRKASNLAEAIAEQRAAIADGQDIQTLAEALGTGGKDWGRSLGQDTATGDFIKDFLKNRSGSDLGHPDGEIANRISSYLDVITPERDAGKLASLAIDGANATRQAGKSNLRQVVGDAYESLDWTGSPSEEIQRLATTPVARKVGNEAFSGVPGGMPDNLNLRDYQTLKSALGKVGDSKAFGTEAVLADQSARVGGQITSELRKLVPGLAEVDDAYPAMKQAAFGGMSLKEGGAQDMLASLARTTPDDLPGIGRGILGSRYTDTIKELAGGMRDIGPKGDAPLRAMARLSIDDSVAKKEGLGLIRGIVGKGQGNRSALGEIVGDDAVAKLDRQLGRELNWKELENKTLHNSTTASNLNQIEATKGLLGSVMAVLRSPKAESIAALKAAFTDEMIDANLKQEIARILFSQGEDSIQKAQRLMPYIKKLHQIDMMAQQIVSGSRRLGSATGIGAVNGIRRR